MFFPDFIDILQRKHCNKRYIVDLEANIFSMIPNMTDFEIMEVSGHMAAVGHTQGLGNSQDHRNTDGCLVHGVFIHVTNCHPHKFSNNYPSM